MTKLVSGDGRTHIESRLMRESLQDRGVLVADRQRARPRRSSPTSRWSRSAARASSIAARTRSCRSSTSSSQIKRDTSVKMVIGVGGGTRVRHTISIALDLGLPTGGIAQLVGAMEELNAILLNALLAHARLDADAARALLGAAALLRHRHHADRDLGAAVSLLGAAARRRARCRCTAPTSACSSSPRCSA